MEKEKVLVVGTGKSGIAATQLLLRTGKMPVLFDSNAELDKDEILGKLSLSGDEKKQEPKRQKQHQQCTHQKHFAIFPLFPCAIHFSPLRLLRSSANEICFPSGRIIVNSWRNKRTDMSCVFSNISSFKGYGCSQSGQLSK